MNEILTVAEVAAWLKVDPLTIYRLARTRTIPAFRIGNAWRFVASDLELWLEHITVMGRPAQVRSPRPPHQA